MKALRCINGSSINRFSDQKSCVHQQTSLFYFFFIDYFFTSSLFCHTLYDGKRNQAVRNDVQKWNEIEYRGQKQRRLFWFSKWIFFLFFSSFFSLLSLQFIHIKEKTSQINFNSALDVYIYLHCRNIYIYMP